MTPWLAQIWPSALDRRRVVQHPEQNLDGGGGEHHRRHLLEFTVRFAVRIAGDPRGGGVAGDLVPFEHGRVHRREVGAGVEDEDRSVERHPVEMVAGEPGFRTEVDRVESADHDRLARSGGCRVEFPEAVEEGVVGADAGCDASVHTVAVEPPHVRQQGERAFQGVGVGLDHARHDHVLGEAPVDGVSSPTRALVERTGSEDTSVPYGDRLDRGLRRIHRDDGPGRKDGDLAHGRKVAVHPRCPVARRRVVHRCLTPMHDLTGQARSGATSAATTSRWSRSARSRTCR